jgi:hypothetical protein
MTDEMTTYCIYCGTQNPVSAETCVSCNQELILPHPIQMEGGEIYTLRCVKCGERLPVIETQGYVSCAVCGLTHAIIAGDGYLTVSPAPGVTASSSIQDFLAMEVAPVENMPPLPQQAPQGNPYQPNAAIPLQWQIDILQKKFYKKSSELKKRQNRRTTGTVLLIMGLLVFILVEIDLANYNSLGAAGGAILFIASIISFLIGFILLIATGKRGDRRIEAELLSVQRELDQIRDPRNSFPYQGVYR